MVVGDLHPKEEDLTLLKLAFTESEAQPILSKLLQDLIDPIPVCGQILREHYNVIDIGSDMSSHNLFSQHVIHEALEGCRCILQPEPHNGQFKESMRH